MAEAMPLTEEELRGVDERKEVLITEGDLMRGRRC